MITPWFLEQIEDIIKTENELTKQDLNQDLMTKAKRKGFQML